MVENRILTNFVCIATVGATVDGRHIEARPQRAWQKATIPKSILL